MSFTRKKYQELLSAVVESDYRSVLFDEDQGEQGNLFMRHDVDKSLDASIIIAEMDQKAGLKSTFFFLTRSLMYNLLEPEAIEKIQSISDMGHAIGLHFDPTRVPGTSASVDSQSDWTSFHEAVRREKRLMSSILNCPVTDTVSFHNPPSFLLRSDQTVDVYTSTYNKNFMMPKTKYISESNGSWHEQNPIGHIRNMKWDRLQMLTHPVWWFQEEEISSVKIIEKVLEHRITEIDEYLKYSNNLWRNKKADGTGQ